ncbi:hypothetical protein HPB50_001576 [Hyalomma asiaticum]|uniref:Uncharacterized protein n=1 Tax=Hyalomma asiaticum TaxID=266040 RepID=A0ACB7SJR0_HYAAI|nr:hypothetical protein HPB50_001576 [Hyalomma asiaticum]
MRETEKESAYEDESVLERLRQAREEDPQQVVSAILTICLNHIVFTLIVVATFMVPAASLLIGALTIHECPHQPMVPVLLVLGGLLALVNGAGNIRRLHPAADQEERKLLGVVTALLNVALLVVFIVGCAYVYGSLWPSRDRASVDYCSPTAFYFAFWLHTGLFIFLGLLIVIGQLCRCRR